MSSPAAASTTGNALINHPKVAMVSLTGTIDTGKKVLQAASATIKRTHLELGGKAPVIVFDDADLGVGGRRHQGVRLLQRRPGLHRRLPHLCRQEDLRQAGRRPVERRQGAEIQSAQRRRERDRPADLTAPEGPRAKLRRARWRAEAHLDHRRRQIAGRQGLLLRADGRRRRAAGRRDRAQRGVRPGGLGHPLRRRRPGRRLGQRQRLRPRLLGVDHGHRQGHGDGGAAAIRLHLGQHPLHAGERDAAWRAQALGLRQGPVDVRARGLHRRRAT